MIAMDFDGITRSAHAPIGKDPIMRSLNKEKLQYVASFSKWLAPIIIKERDTARSIYSTEARAGP